MTIKEAFKQGFAEELAIRGLEPKQFDKTAVVEFNLKGLGDLLKDAPAAYLALAAGVPFAAGGALGYGWGRTGRVSQPDLRQTKDITMLHEYNAAIKQLERERDRRKAITA